MPDVSTALRFARHDKGCLAAFTLIELLVVIAVIALLMAILMPTVQRARKQANDVGCRANLREWGVVINVDAAENDSEPMPNVENFFGSNAPGGVSIWDYAGGRRVLALCPSASRLAKDVVVESDGTRHARGSAFYAGWSDHGRILAFSYGLNTTLMPRRSPEHPKTPYRWWSSVTRKGCPHASVPVVCDSLRNPDVTRDDSWLGPPPFEDYVGPSDPWSEWPFLCFNRHKGGVNYLFLDWSVRKVGVKELWTLKWDGDFDTAGPWTKRGGVKPEDWPPWLRRFKDY